MHSIFAGQNKVCIPKIIITDTASTAAGHENPQLARLPSGIASAVDSPLLTQLMESPFTSTSRQTLYTQLRKLKLEVGYRLVGILDCTGLWAAPL